MKTIIVAIVCLSSFKLMAQFDNYSGVGITPRFILETPYTEMLQAYEARFDSVTKHFDLPFIIPGIAVRASIGYDWFSLGYGCGINGYYLYGEQINSIKEVATARLIILYPSLFLESHIAMLHTDKFIFAPGAGCEVGGETISGKLENNDAYTSFQGGLGGDPYFGVYADFIILIDVGSYNITIQPSYRYMFKNHRTNEVYENMTREFDISDFTGPSRFLGIDLFYNLW